MGLPEPNNFLPNSLDVLPPNESESNVPKLVKEWEGDGELWFMKDDKFNRPKAIVNLKFYPHGGLFQELGLTAKGRTLAEVWV